MLLMVNCTTQQKHVQKFKIVQIVRINGELTDWFSCKTGVKQRDNLSPTLFSIFIKSKFGSRNNKPTVIYAVICR